MKMRISITFIFMLATIAVNVNCENLTSTTLKQNKDSDSSSRPTYVPAEASLIRFGSPEEPRFVWYQVIGPYKRAGKQYPHILGVKYYYSKDQIDTVYYENLAIRGGAEKVDIDKFKLPFSQVDESNLDVVNNDRTYELFEVLFHGNGANETENSALFSRRSTIRRVASSYLASNPIELKIQRNNNLQYQVNLRDGAKLLYRVKGDCPGNENVISFINTENGNIYFVGTSCYLELEKGSDVTILKGKL